MSTAFRVILEGSQETPVPTPSTASGLGTVIFDNTAVIARAIRSASKVSTSARFWVSHHRRRRIPVTT